MLAVTGESGSGKSTAGRTVLQLEVPTEGTITFEGTDLAGLSSSQLRKMRPRMQMVFQNPHSSLNPRMTVASIIGEPLVEHSAGNKQERKDRIGDLLQERLRKPGRRVHAQRVAQTRGVFTPCPQPGHRTPPTEPALSSWVIRCDT